MNYWWKTLEMPSKQSSSSDTSAGQRFPPHNGTLGVGEFRVGGGVHDSYTLVRTGGIFYFPWHRHQIEGTDGFLVSPPKDTGRAG